MIERFKLLRNVGQFDSVDACSKLPLSALTLIYAENGRGKTTLATILRSLSTGDPSLIKERHRLGAIHAPQIVLTDNGRDIIFKDGSWSKTCPNIMIFDDAFVADNICSGVQIEASHRRNLHELILGAQGVALNADLHHHIEAIDLQNRELRAKEAEIRSAPPNGMSVDDFCSLSIDDKIDENIKDLERQVAAAQAVESIRKREAFAPFSLPGFDLIAIENILMRGLHEAQADTFARVRNHLMKLGDGGEAWLGEGMSRISVGGKDANPCPFCDQDLMGSPLIIHYQIYFSEAYKALKQAIVETGTGIRDNHSDQIQFEFEHLVVSLTQDRAFWQGFTDLPSVDVDVPEVRKNWKAARDQVLNVLRAKAAAPLDAIPLPQEAIAAVELFERDRLAVSNLSAQLMASNEKIIRIKAKASAANLAELTTQLARLHATKMRHSAPLNAACDAYVFEKKAKSVSEAKRDEARAPLHRYRTSVFPKYQDSINYYLGRFNAGFRLGDVTAVNSRAGSSASYKVVINDVPVELLNDTGPSFRTTLSAGDRNTLALAFFFSSLDQDSNFAEKIVVIDDPMTSLDEHRRLMTVQEILGLAGRARQVILLSHSKSFLCAVWEGYRKSERCALHVHRSGSGSDLSVWDVNRDCITEHDRRYALLKCYLKREDKEKQRAVAEGLRFMLEAYVRVAHPDLFLPGGNFSDFLKACRKQIKQGSEVLSEERIDELEHLLRYAHQFHHDGNPDYRSPSINDQELADYAKRTIRFLSSK